MNTGKLSVHLDSWMKQSGYFSRSVSVGHLREVEDKIRNSLEDGSFDPVFARERLMSFRFLTPASSRWSSILIIAVPQPAVLLKFIWQGSSHKVTLPPTYDYSVNFTVKNQLEKLLYPYGFKIEQANLPLKIMAVRSGLAEYGRNNICYIPGRGSFFRLMAFYTDVPGLKDHWGVPVMMNKCRTCRACIRECPQGAIGDDRFLLHAERCLTYHNERPGNFPQNIDKTLHHCLLGCMICQRICPENKKNNEWAEEKEEFTEKETTMILDEIPADGLPVKTRGKLERLCLLDDYPLLARNLGALLPLS